MSSFKQYITETEVKKTKQGALKQQKIQQQKTYYVINVLKIKSNIEFIRTMSLTYAYKLIKFCSCSE